MSLGLETTPKVIESQGKIEAIVAQYLECDEKFTQYNNEKLFLTELSKAVVQDDVIVLAAEAELFAPFKSFIAKAFQLRKKQNRQILRLIRSSYPDIKPETEEFKNQTTIPVGSTPLLSDDGLYSGFAIKSNNQIVIVLPLEPERLGTILNIGVVQYLLNTLPTIDKAKQEDEKSQIAGETQDQIVVNERKSEQPYDKEFIKNTVKELIEKQLYFSIANTKTLDFFYNISNEVSDLSKVALVSDYYVEKGKMPLREYAINLARGAKQSLDAPIGVGLTQVFTTSKQNGETEMFIYICIADEHQANAIKMFAKPEETPPQLIFSAINELFKMILSWANTGEVIPPPPVKSIEEIKKSQEIEEDKNKEKIKIIVAAILSLAVVLSVLIAVFFNDIYNIHGTLAKKEQSQAVAIISSSIFNKMQNTDFITQVDFNTI